MPEPRRYLLAGEPVTVLVWPNQKRKNRPAKRIPLPRIGDYAPVNVLIEREDGSRQVRPFRGLRRSHV